MIIYTIDIKDCDQDKLNTLESELRDIFKIDFIGIDQFELKISFEIKLSEEQEDLLIETINRVIN